MNATGATVREYIYLPEAEIAPTRGSRTTVDRPIAVVDAVNTTPVTLYVHVDHLHRPVRMTNAAKATVWDVIWTPWGSPHTITGAQTLNARFPGQWFQLEAGLHYNWHRHYDPSLGRYTQPDPLGFVDGPSVYAYARSAPTVGIDFLGLQSSTGGTPAADNAQCRTKKCPMRTYHRLVVNDDEYDLVLSTSMVCGRQGRQGRGICARAYSGPLPYPEKGIEFQTDICPSSDRTPVGGEGAVVQWCLGSPDVLILDGGDMACIPVTVTKENRYGGH